ncbi:hypothetical protein [Pedobacter insulae]|uniref:Uncharacterized protein n=1 Tax=Pedobacter insulae TaxID=414048 RepID=A0A1I2YJ53_9SPHI|nr:hypothetical protein [Pedobacter insulae]SFH25547.1 hypothetical protein SAMN04489864_107129 [Pedobacter insulae]
MKNYFRLTAVLLGSIALFLSSCKVEPDIHVDPDKDEPSSYTLKISIAPPSGTHSDLNDLSAVISLTKENGETVLTDKVLELTHNGKYNTPEIPVTKGNYKLVKLIVKKADGSVIYASPITGSLKANHVSKSLALNANITTAKTTLDVEVLPVTTTERPQDFGYIDGTFNEKPTENPATEFTITIKPLFTIGNVVYDSIPVSLKLTTYPITGEPLTTIQALGAGEKKLTLSKQATKYTLSITKWGMNASATILPNDMKDGITYSLAGSKAAKKLKYVSVYRPSGNSWLPDTREEYLYENEKLNLINHYRKAADNSNLLEMKEEIIYENNRISKIKKSKDDYIASYTYKSDGKLDRIAYTDRDGQTSGMINYVALPGRTGVTDNYGVGTDRESSKFYYKQYISYEILGGNVRKYNYATSHGDSESTLIDYDFQINPYIHLHLPELGLNTLSKNNVTQRVATYSVTIPQHDAYEYSYVYDSEGYPTELYTKYRIPGTATTIFTTKTVFNYY